MATKTKTSTERVRDLRKRRAAEGLTEVRGIWAKPEHHKQIKAYGRGIDQLKKSASKGRLQKTVDDLLK